MGSTPNFPHSMGRVFQLIVDRHYINSQALPFPGAILLTPEPIAEETAITAWTYALRFSAKGLDLPDYVAALELLIQRHPSWEIVDNRVHHVKADMSKAVEDIPEQ